MWLSARAVLHIWLIVLGTSLVVWVLLLVNPGNIMTIEHCVMPATLLCSGNTIAPIEVNSFDMLLELNPFSMQLLGWGLMVMAMMLPKLTAPIQHIYIRSFKRYRFIFAILFIVGYLSTWMVAGIIMTAIILVFNFLFPMSLLPAICIGLIAIIYQCSPAKQLFLNRGHDHKSLPAFGFPAFRAVAVFGVMHGVWCVGSGWALMLMPMLLPEGHNIAMIIVTFMMISEHMEHPQPIKWGFKPRLILIKYLVAPVKFKLLYGFIIPKIWEVNNWLSQWKSSLNRLTNIWTVR